MTESGRTIFQKAKLGKVTNRQIVKYGKINENIGYELAKQNYKEHYYLAFVEKIGDKYVYDVDKCVDGDLNEILTYIKECKESKKILDRKVITSKIMSKKLKVYKKY